MLDYCFSTILFHSPDHTICTPIADDACSLPRSLSLKQPLNTCCAQMHPCIRILVYVDT